MTIAGPSPGTRNVAGWKTAALSATGALLLALVGWIATTETTARLKMAADIADDSKRIAIVEARAAVLEEANRNIRDSQARIERVLDEIRKDLQERRR